MTMSTVGGSLYVSATPGEPDTTGCTATGEWLRQIGYVTQAGTYFFNPSTDYLKVGSP